MMIVYILEMTSPELALKYTEEELREVLARLACNEMERQRLQDAIELCEQGYIEIKESK